MTLRAILAVLVLFHVSMLTTGCDGRFNVRFGIAYFSHQEPGFNTTVYSRRIFHGLVNELFVRGISLV